MKGLVPATSHCDKFHRVNWPFFASKSGRMDQRWSQTVHSLSDLHTGKKKRARQERSTVLSRAFPPRVQRSNKIHEKIECCEQYTLVPAASPTNSCPYDWLFKTLRVNCSWDKSLRPAPSCKLLRRLVAGTSLRD